jgi:paraquat-inducible protein A
MKTSSDTTVAYCHVCGQTHSMPPLEPGTVALCACCGSKLSRRARGSLHLTAALSLAALILYVPANVFPILRIEIYGARTENTVWQGCQRLYHDGDWFIAAVVFLASIFVPLVKLLGLFMLVFTSWLHLRSGKQWRMWTFKFIDTIGRWAMLDVFVVAVLVSLVKLRRLATIMPGKGLFAFCCVVVLTLLASACFDPRLISNHSEDSR